MQCRWKIEQSLCGNVHILKDNEQKLACSCLTLICLLNGSGREVFWKGDKKFQISFEWLVLAESVDFERPPTGSENADILKSIIKLGHQKS